MSTRSSLSGSRKLTSVRELCPRSSALRAVQYLSTSRSSLVCRTHSPCRVEKAVWSVRIRCFPFAMLMVHPKVISGKDAVRRAICFLSTVVENMFTRFS